MAASDIITDMGSFRQLYDIMGGIERAMAAIDTALNEGFGTGHRHLVVSGFAVICASCVHAAIDRAVIVNCHAVVIGCT